MPLVSGVGTISVALTSTSAISLNSREAQLSLRPQSVVETTDNVQPTNISPPTISRSAREGQTLTADPGSWSGSPLAYSYQWLRCDTDDGDCAEIVGATALTYTLTSDDAGSGMSVRVTASNLAGSTVASSNTTAPVQAISPANTDPPAITGTLEKGSTLTAGSGTWLGTQPISYAFQWRRCDATGANCVVISGAGGQSYTLTISDIGSAIRVNVTASNSAGTDSALTDPTAPVKGVYRAEVMADSPVGYWRLGESTGTTAADETSNNDAGSYLGGIALGAPGALVGDLNTAPSFDGVNDQINMGNPASGIFKFGTSNFTVEAWLKTPVMGSKLTDDMPIVAKQSPVTTNPSWEVTFTDDTGFVGRIRAKLNDSNGTNLKAYSSVRIDDGKWHHIVATFNRANGITVYVDNVPAFTAGATLGDVNDNTNLLIGRMLFQSPCLSLYCP